MSVFQVNLHSFNTGPLDPSAFNQGYPSGSALPRTMYAAGPNLINRILTDGATFTDSNYWKQFAYPQMPLGSAFITVLQDDGSTYQAGEVTAYPKVYNITAAGGSTYTTAGNAATILSDTGSTAIFAQITNNSGSGSVNVRLNGSTGAIFTLPAGHSQVFNAGDLNISLIEIDNSASGAGTESVQILVSVQSISHS